jgi:membrane protein
MSLRIELRMKRRIIKDIAKIIKTTFRNWFKRDPFHEGAIIAYYAIFSLPGLLVVTIALSGYFFGAEAVSGHLQYQISEAVGKETAVQVQAIIAMASKSKDTVWAAILGIGTMLFGATAVFAQLQKIINNIWNVEVKTKRSGIWIFIKTRLFSFGLIISIAFLLLVSLVLTTLIAAFSTWIQQFWSESVLLFFKVINAIFSFGIITLLFAMMFKFLPDAKVKWRSVWVGGMVTSMLFVIGKTALGLYFEKANPGSGYGAAGSVILLLLWSSYSSMIVFFGAEFTKVFSDHFYGIAPPSEIAIETTTGPKTE